MFRNIVFVFFYKKKESDKKRLIKKNESPMIKKR